MKRLMLLLMVVVAVASTGLANIANPDLPGRKKTIDTELSISLDSRAKEARLIIPRSQLKQLRAEIEQLDDSNDSAAGTFQGTQTVISGGLISLAFIFADVVLPFGST